MRFQREWFLLIGSLLVAAALYGHYLGHSVLSVEIAMLVAGVAMALYAARSIAAKKTDVADGLVFRIVARYVKRENTALVMSASGFLLLFAWSAYKLFIVQATDLHLKDFIVTVFGVALILYNTAPSKLYSVQDFAVLYLFFLVIVFVVIWGVYSLVSGESYVRITAYSEYYIVTVPVSGILNALGFQVYPSLNLNGPGLSNIIDYEHDGVMLKLGIGTGCSGLYSAGLFFSAFLAFILVRYQKVDAPAAAALGVGFAVTWLSNIIRMVITIAAGIAWGHPTLVFVHIFIGILIFVAFITAFWLLIVRWLDKVYEKRAKTAEPSAAVTP